MHADFDACTRMCARVSPGCLATLQRISPALGWPILCFDTENLILLECHLPVIMPVHELNRTAAVEESLILMEDYWAVMAAKNWLRRRSLRGLSPGPQSASIPVFDGFCVTFLCHERIKPGQIGSVTKCDIVTRHTVVNPTAILPSTEQHRTYLLPAELNRPRGRAKQERMERSDSGSAYYTVEHLNTGTLCSQQTTWLPVLFVVVCWKCSPPGLRTKEPS